MDKKINTYVLQDAAYEALKRQIHQGVPYNVDQAKVRKIPKTKSIKMLPGRVKDRPIQNKTKTKISNKANGRVTEVMKWSNGQNRRQAPPPCRGMWYGRVAATPPKSNTIPRKKYTIK